MTDFKPRNDLVLVLVDGARERYGKLYIPAAAIKIPTRGTVIDVGPGYLLADGTRSTPDLKEGDRVEFQMHPGMHQINDGDALFYMMRESEILATVLNEPIPDMLDSSPSDESPADAEGGVEVDRGRIMLARS